jgi:hypothetical protein
MPVKLHYRQYEAIQLIKNPDNDIAGYMGGIRSGKSITGAQWAYDMIFERPEEIGAIFSPTNKQLTQMTLKEFKKLLGWHGIEQDRDYVVNVNPKRKFKYKTKWPSNHNGIWSFWNGAQIYTFSLESFFRGAEFGWAWGDEIQSTTAESLDEATGRMSGSEDPKTFYTFTAPLDNPDIDKIAYGDINGEGRIPLAVGTTYDNEDNLSQKYLRKLERYDKYTFAREVMCERVTMAGLNWLYSFDRNKHVSTKAVYDPGKMVYVSIDFNMNPFVATLSHRGRNAEGKLYIHYFDTVILTPEQIIGQEYIAALVNEIRVRTPFQSKHNSYMVTGDATARRGDVIAKVGETVWSKVVDAFKIDVRNQLVVGNSNSTHQDSRVLCNAIWANYPEILVHPKNGEFIRDCEFVKAKPDGSILKDNRSDIHQQADLLDTMRYDLAAFNYDFIDIRG